MHTPRKAAICKKKIRRRRRSENNYLLLISLRLQILFGKDNRFDPLLPNKADILGTKNRIVKRIIY